MDLLESGGGKGERKKKEKINSFIQMIMKFKICLTTEKKDPGHFMMQFLSSILIFLLRNKS